MKRRKQKALRVLMTVVFSSAFVVAAHQLTASLYSGDEYTSIEVDGVDFGRFSSIEGLDELEQYFTSVTKDEESRPDAESVTAGNYRVLTLQRDFVTDPSLYLWARNSVAQRSGLKDVHVVVRDEAGRELRRSVLRLCQPLSWTVEASNSGTGGFHEVVTLAVHDVSMGQF